MNPVELLAPAGSPEALDAAVAEGADAIYLGLKKFNARMRTSNFAYSQFESAVKSLHRNGRKIYVTVNTVFEQREADRMYQFLKYLAAVGPDGIIVQDFGVARMARECFPTLKLHASTQMNVASSRGANLLSKYGFNRVVLSRELNMSEIRGVRENTTVGLEIFIHGALCVSESGLCFFSSYLGGKSANRGMCTQACRRLYRNEGDTGYYFSPADMQVAERVPELVDLGVASLKIEGRMKSAEYVGTVVSAYRHILDGMSGDRERVVKEALSILQNDFARPKTSFHHGGTAPASWLKADQSGGTGRPLGKIIRVRGGGEHRLGLIIASEPRPVIGDSIRLHRLDDSNRKSHKITAVEGSGMEDLWISIPEGFDVGDSVYLIQTKSMTKRYPQVLSKDLSTFRRLPGRDSAPAIELPRPEKADRDLFPEGIYAAVSKPEDLYILQGMRPVRAMLAYTRAAAKRILMSSEPLPFSKNELVLVLDPFYPQGVEELMAEELPQLLALGYRQFVVNNLAHYSFFRGTDARLIAGPYLYTFNRWSYAFVSGLGSPYLVTPLENNRQNLDRTVPESRRPFTFVTLFSYPALFRIRADISDLYRFKTFTDGRDERFRISGGDDGTTVFPEKPFSIVDKMIFLKESGFSRFIIDFSGVALKKLDYKDVMSAVRENMPLPFTTRFNWKDGFFAPSEDSSGLAKTPKPRSQGIPQSRRTPKPR